MEWWLHVVAYLAATRGCVSRAQLGGVLGITSNRARSLLWAAARSGVLVQAKDGGCYGPSERGLRIATRVLAAARRHRAIVLLEPGVVVAAHTRRSRILAYPIPLDLICRVLRSVEDGVNPAELPRKTVSRALRILNLLGCPGPFCLLASSCAEHH